MCEYSLHAVATRPAKVGDKLVTTDFPNSITRGFCDISCAEVAVCLSPGTEIVFDEEVRRETFLGLLLQNPRFGKLGSAVARFRRINTDDPNTHHDALEFANGSIVLLTKLWPGQHATVLQLPARLDRVATPSDDRSVEVAAG